MCGVPAGVADGDQPPRGRVMKTQLSLTQSPRLDPTCKDYDARGFTDNVLRHSIINL